MSRLTGKVCVITGASGMTAAAALRFAEEGAEVFVVPLHEAECRSLRLPFAVADLRDEASTEAAFAAATAHRGRIDAAADPDSVAFAQRAQPLSGGFLDPDDVVEAAVYLCADESRAVTGQVLAIDGGWGVRGGRG